MPPPPLRAAVYLRVSNEFLTLENQRQGVDAIVKARGLEPTYYEETASAVAAKRPEYARMMDDARRGRVGVVVVWALDRLHRNMNQCLATVVELDRLGVAVVSVQEGWLDTSGPVRSLLVAIFGWVAEQERARLIERTKAGMARAKAAGRRPGRPAETSPIMLGAAADLVRGGCSVKAAAKEKGVPRSSLRRYLGVAI